MASLTLPESSLLRWWRLRSTGERSLMRAIAALSILVLAWVALWQPLQRDSARLQRQVLAQKAALTEAQRQADEIASLARQAQPEAARDLRTELTVALAKQQPRLAPTAVEAADQGALRVIFETIGFDSLVGLLQTLQRDARIRATELSATARVEAGQVRAEIILSR